jgi:FdhD protein
LLFTENAYINLSADPEIVIEEKSDSGFISAVNVIAPQDQIEKGAETLRNIMSVSSCGLCGKSDLGEVSEKRFPCMEQYEASTIRMMFSRMNSVQDTFIKSGGSHACAAFDISGNLLSSHEDIGRHNAVDKVIGDLILKKQLPQARCLTVSGRYSYEIVNKCFVAGIHSLLQFQRHLLCPLNLQRRKELRSWDFVGKKIRRLVFIRKESPQIQRFLFRLSK